MERDEAKARAILDQLAEYTEAVCDHLNIRYRQSGKNHYGPFPDGKPIGAINHYTASNSSITKKRPLGRIPVLLNRFARGGSAKVGIHFIVWDQKQPQLDQIRSKYPLLKEVPGELFFFGDDLAFWHGGWTNKFAYGVEIRNLGSLIKRNNLFYWNNGKYRYRGRKPIKIGKGYWEPYTYQQMATTLYMHRLMSTIHNIQPEWFLGHMHVSSTRIDPGKHFPLHEMREHALFSKEIPLDRVEFLKEFQDDTPAEDRDDPLISEESLHMGLYRDDWDGIPEDNYNLAPQPRSANDQKEDKIIQHKKTLLSLGYYPGPLDDVVDQQYKNTVYAFRMRWKKRIRKGGRFIQELSPGYEMDEAAQLKLHQLTSQWDRL